MILVDTNVVIDVLERDPAWFQWSAGKLSDGAATGDARICSVVVAELSRGFDALPGLRAKLDQVAISIAPLEDEAAFLAGKRFRQFRKDRAAGDNARVLPDFLIGAQALTLGGPLLTRDPRLYRRYFPDLSLITPETHP